MYSSDWFDYKFLNVWYCGIFFLKSELFRSDGLECELAVMHNTYTILKYKELLSEKNWHIILPYVTLHF